MKTLKVIGLVGLICGGILLLAFILNSALVGSSGGANYGPIDDDDVTHIFGNENTLPELNKQSQPNESLFPVRLVIPSIKVDSRVQHVGVVASGNMAVPSNFVDVGWYKFGIKPGAEGSAVMAGHVNNALGTAGVFAQLSKILPGDKIQVILNDGSNLIYQVTHYKIYDSGDKTDDVFLSQGTSKLNLITCDGVWDNTEREYGSRYVVFSELIE